ncbi:three-Cys-motif partner protein TcmP [bacterium]|nr:three-Cys-motif partner protein TcmP [bacterium]
MTEPANATPDPEDVNGADSAEASCADDLESTEGSFFKGKRPWSRIKDQILGQYMPAYLSKVRKLHKPIILIDAFAGPGKFEDGAAGSPLIICQAADQHVRGSYLAIFVNREKEHHDQLSHVLSRFIDQQKVIPIHGSADVLLAKVRDVLADHTLFLYLDPFGLKGCEFSLIEPFLRRDRAYSTEIVVNLSIPTMHRLAARKAVAAGRGGDPRIRSFHERLTRVLGGDYWKDILCDDSREPEAKAEDVMAVYRERILGYDQPKAFSGSCPVREKKGSGIKYYVTFYSRHRDAMLLMNDAMCIAYYKRMHEAATHGTLFANTDWRDGRDTRGLESAILDAVREMPRRSRLDLWVEIVQRFFMRYTASEYKAAVAKLVKDNRLPFEDVRGTRRLNDESRLCLVEDGSG